MQRISPFSPFFSFSFFFVFFFFFSPFLFFFFFCLGMGYVDIRQREEGKWRAGMEKMRMGRMVANGGPSNTACV